MPQGTGQNAIKTQTKRRETRKMQRETRRLPPPVPPLPPAPSAPGRPRAVALWPALVIAWIGLCLSFSPNAGVDLLWQLRAGHDILASGRPPHHDHYSWSRLGAPWAAVEWLSFVLFWTLYSLGGFAALWELTALLTIALALVLFFSIRRETGSPFAAFGLSALALTTASTFLEPRPQMFTFLLLTLTAGLAMSVRGEPAQGRRLWFLLPVFVVWANLHPGVLTALAALLTLAAGDGLEAAWRKRQGDSTFAEALVRRAALFGGVGLAGMAASLVTPYGIRLYTDVLATVSSPQAMSFVHEWHPYWGSTIHGEWGYPLLCALFFLAYLRTRKRRSWGEMLVVAGLAWQAYQHVRNIPLFALAGVVIAAPHIVSASASLVPNEDRAPRRGRRESPGASPAPLGLLFVTLSALAWYTTLALQTLDSTPPSPASLPERIGEGDIRLSIFPEAACRFMEAEHFPTSLHLLNDYDLGGYLIWRLPQYPVFVDGRADVYLGPVLNDYIKITGSDSQEQCRSELNAYPFDCVITRLSQQASLFGHSPDWALVYADRAARLSDPQPNTWIFLRRSPQYQPLIDRCRKDWAEQNSDGPEK